MRGIPYLDVFLQGEQGQSERFFVWISEFLDDLRGFDMGSIDKSRVDSMSGGGRRTERKRGTSDGPCS